MHNVSDDLDSSSVTRHTSHGDQRAHATDLQDISLRVLTRQLDSTHSVAFSCGLCSLWNLLRMLFLILTLSVTIRTR